MNNQLHFIVGVMVKRYHLDKVADMIQSARIQSGIDKIF